MRNPRHQTFTFHATHLYALLVTRYVHGNADAATPPLASSPFTRSSTFSPVASPEIRLMRPERTPPGPTSINVCTPLSVIERTEATHATCLQSCSESSRRMSSAVV